MFVKAAYRPAAIAAGLATLTFAPACASAETLADAIALAYQSNPTLQGGREQLRALDETYVQARAGWRPSAALQIQANRSLSPQASLFGGLSEVASNSASAGLSVTQPIFTGGRTAAEVRATEADVLGGREGLRGLEDSVLQNVIAAYVDVRRDQRILAVREQDISLLQSQLDDANMRFKAGEVTRTDVEQSETQLAASRALLSLAQGQLQISRAGYAGVVGQNPGGLAPEPPLPGLPDDVDKAFDIAERNNPTLRRAEITEEASRLRIVEARSAFRPTVSVSASIGSTGVALPFNANDYKEAVQATATISQPIFTGGVNSSNVRRAIDLNNSDRINIEGTRRSVVQNLSQAWNQMLSTRASALSDVQQIRAARLYYEDTQAEYRAGQRTTLDVLVAEQSLRDAQIALAQAEHDRYVAEAAVLSNMGELEVARLVPETPRYDPARSFRRVRDEGATPWEGLIATVDDLGAPSVGAPHPLDGPPPARGPVSLSRGDPAAPASPNPDTVVPTAPMINTTRPDTPATLGQTPAEAALARDPR